MTPTDPLRRAIDWGELRSFRPLDSNFGLGRGRPVDRHYIDGFIGRHAADIHGSVLEVGDPEYTQRFGAERVRHSDVVHAEPGNPNATIVASLVDAPEIESDRYDCFICTQTLTYIYPLARAVETIHRILKPGGVVLISVPGITQTSPYDSEHFGEHWRFTHDSLKRLLDDGFPGGEVDVQAHGNLIAATAFLHGLAVDDLEAAELDHRDDRYQMLITGRARKAG